MKDNAELYCIDWDDDNPYLIYGIEDDPDYARLDFKLSPCNEISIDPEVFPDCNVDREK